MIVFLVAVFLGIWLLQEQLTFAFLSNTIINSIILAAFIIGILFIIRQNIRLIPEYRWMRKQQRGGRAKAAKKPNLLATVAVMTGDDHDGDRTITSLSAQNLRSVLDSVAVRLNEGREISRYMIGLLVFLGLLGTFWGLLTTVQSVGDVVGNIDAGDNNLDTLVLKLQSGLTAPISGMATAFSSSLFGLAGSLILGFLDLQLGQAMGSFFTDVEDWLNKRLEFKNELGLSSDTPPELTLGILEVTSNKMQNLTRAVANSEKDRIAISENIKEMTKVLNKLHDGLARDALMADNISNLDSSIQSLVREIKDDRAELSDTIATELRALTKALTRSGK